MAGIFGKSILYLRNAYRRFCHKLGSRKDVGQARKSILTNTPNTYSGCTKCAPNASKDDLVVDTEIYKDSHDFANIEYCSFCHSYFLYYWVEVFDDGWKYWVIIDEKERDYIMHIDIDKYPKGTITEFIKTKQQVLCKSPSYQYATMSGADCLLDGPPW